jgi:hypothetical protein
MYRTVETLASSPFVRGGVSGIGVITVIAGLSELASAIVSRRRHATDAPPHAGP